jgi:hypothetical protein
MRDRARRNWPGPLTYQPGLEADMSVEKNIAFCTTCKSRTQHLELTLPRNLADNADYPNCKFVVLDYNSPDHINTYLLKNHKSDIDSGRLVVYTMLPRDDGYVFPFRMSHAKNMAHRCGMLEGGNILVNLDADGFSGPGFARWLSDKFLKNDHIVIQAMWNRWVEKDGEQVWLAQDANGEFGPPVPKGSNGRMAVTRDAFLLAGGYDEKYETWGADDKDFNIRLRRLGYAPELLDRKYQDTVLHNNKVRFREYPQAIEKMNSYEFNISVDDCDDTISNFGNVGLGTVYRNFDFSNPIQLLPIPTRIFGVGLHKTATTSLHTALKILGLDSAHWTTAHWAKAVWQEMTTLGRSATLERSYAVSDLPIPVLYRELDKAYPNSKFVLTIRDEDKWLDSVRRHWNPHYNKFRKWWDHDPFSHFIHKEIYGRRDFNPEIFLARYRRHNAEVLEYFKLRPADLLTFNVDAGHGWNELCRFLRKPVPSVAYPIVYYGECENGN